MNDDRERAQGKEPGHEPLSVSVKAIAISTIALVILIVVTIVAMAPLPRMLSPRDAAEEVDYFVQLPLEAPQTTVGLNPNQTEDRLKLEARQREWLGEYAWLDDEEQIARIPIERAMEIIRERGLQVVTDSDDASSAVQDERADDEGGPE